MTTIEMANVVLLHSGRSMNASELLGTMRAMLAIRQWDDLDELLAGRSQAQALIELLERDRSQAWFIRDDEGRYVADQGKLADALFGRDPSN